MRRIKGRMKDATDHQRCYRPSTVSKSAAAADKVDVEFVSNIKELFMKQNKKL